MALEREDFTGKEHSNENMNHTKFTPTFAPANATLRQNMKMYIIRFKYYLSPNSL